MDAFAVGRIQEHWLSEYQNLDDVLNLKDKLGEKNFFCVVSTLQTTEYGDIQVFSVIPKPWLSPDFKCLLYPPKSNLPIDNPALWSEKHFSRNIWPKTSWMEYDVDVVFNSTDDTLRKSTVCFTLRFHKINFLHCVHHLLVRFLKASSKATALQRGEMDASQWFDSDQHLGRAKEGTTRSLRTITLQKKRALSGTICYFVLYLFSFNIGTNVFFILHNRQSITIYIFFVEKKTPTPVATKKPKKNVSSRLLI